MRPACTRRPSPNPFRIRAQARGGTPEIPRTLRLLETRPTRPDDREHPDRLGHVALLLKPHQHPQEEVGHVGGGEVMGEPIAQLVMDGGGAQLVENGAQEQRKARQGVVEDRLQMAVGQTAAPALERVDQERAPVRRAPKT